jgi:hypothetical protein
LSQAADHASLLLSKSINQFKVEALEKRQKDVIPAWFWRESILSLVEKAGSPITAFGDDSHFTRDSINIESF